NVKHVTSGVLIVASVFPPTVAPGSAIFLRSVMDTTPAKNMLICQPAHETVNFAIETIKTFDQSDLRIRDGMILTGFVLLIMATLTYWGDRKSRCEVSRARIYVALYAFCTALFAFIRAIIDTNKVLLIGAATHNTFERGLFGCDYFMLFIYAYRLYYSSDNSPGHDIFKYGLYASIWYFGQIYTLIGLGLGIHEWVALAFEWMLIFSTVPTFYFNRIVVLKWKEMIHNVEHPETKVSQLITSDPNEEGRSEKDSLLDSPEKIQQDEDLCVNISNSHKYYILGICLVLSWITIFGPLIIPECLAQLDAVKPTLPLGPTILSFPEIPSTAVTGMTIINTAPNNKKALLEELQQAIFDQPYYNSLVESMQLIGPFQVVKPGFLVSGLLTMVFQFTVNCPIDYVWPKISNFSDSTFVLGVKKTNLEAPDVKVMVLENDHLVKMRLLKMDNDNHQWIQQMVSGLPFKAYTVTVTLTPGKTGLQNMTLSHYLAEFISSDEMSNIEARNFL
ncbi:9428_t:CDS:2, partial [Diversispora eburnea]